MEKQKIESIVSKLEGLKFKEPENEKKEFNIYCQAVANHTEYYLTKGIECDNFHSLSAANLGNIVGNSSAWNRTAIMEAEKHGRNRSMDYGRNDSTRNLSEAYLNVAQIIRADVLSHK